MTEPAWYPVEDWSTVKVGERVRLENPNKTAVEMDVLDRGMDWVEGVLVRPLFLHDGWALFTTRPPVALPREPGFYLAGRKGARLVVELLNSPAGQWVDASDSQYLDDAEVAELGSLTRLRPEGEERREVAGELLRWVIGQIFGAHRQGWSDGQVAPFEKMRARLQAALGEPS